MTTSAIGISYDSHHSSVCLHEAGPSGPLLSMITDGYRPRIPTAMGPEESWGSAAVGEGDQTAGLGQAPDRRFLKALLARISRHLGGASLAPPAFSPAGGGPAIVIAAPAGDARETHADLQQAFADSGFPVRTVISAPEAILAAGARQIQADPAATLVAAICAGDRATEVAVYRVDEASRPEAGPRMSAAGPSVTLPVGAQKWVEQIARMVIERTTAHGRPLGGPRLLALHDAVLDYCGRLRHQAPGIPLPWDGPLHNRAFTDLSFTRRDCTTLPGASDLQSGLQQALCDGACAAGGGLPSLAVVGGPGAPFGVIQEICQALGLNFVDLRHPELAAARGASLWLDFQKILGASPHPPEPPLHRPAPQPLAPAPSRDLIPPWLRD